MAVYRPGKYAGDEDETDLVEAESVPEVQDRVLSVKLAEQRQPSKLLGADFDAWLQERAQQARADRANEFHPPTGIRLPVDPESDADAAWRGREGPVPTAYSKFPTQPPVSGSVPSGQAVAGRGPIPARQLQQMVTGAAMPSEVAQLRAALSKPDELSPEMAALVEGVGKSAEDIAGRAKFRRAPVAGSIAAGEPGGPPAEAVAARPGSVPGGVREAMTGAAAPSELSALREALSRPLNATPAEEDLAAAQRRDNSGRGLGRVSDALYGAITRTAPKFRDRGENEAGDLLTRRAAGDAEQARQQRAMEDDPTSQDSQNTQALIRTSMPGIASELGPALDRLSHTKAMQAFPFLRDVANKRVAVEAAKTAAEAKAAAEKDRRAWEGGEHQKDRASRERAAGIAGQRRDEAEAAKKSAALAEIETGLRKEFSALPATKDFQQVSAGYQKIRNAGQSAAGDMAMLYGYMKIIDPGSAVKEGEFAAAAESGGWGDRLKVAVSKAAAGERLSPAMRADFISEAKSIYGSQRAQFDRLAKQYQGLAAKAGASPEAIVQDLAVPEEADAPAEAQRAALSVQPGETTMVNGHALVRGPDGKWKPAE